MSAAKTSNAGFMDLSLVLATCKRVPILTRTLSSFTKLEVKGLDWEIIVVDNADDAETKRLIQEFDGQLPLTYVVENRQGKNYALNTAIGKVRGELVVFTDDDVLADSQWLVKILEGAKRWPNHAVFGGRILPSFPTDAVNIDLDNRLVRSAYVIADWKRSEGEYKPSMVWGPNFAVRLGVLREGFQFNTDFGPNSGQYVMGDETEFLYRLERAGYVPIYLPEALVHHQIREEQLTVDWLRGRVASYGGTFAFMSGLPSTPLLLGVPRYIYVQTLQAYVQSVWASVCGNRQRRFETALQYSYRKGMLAQYWKGVPEKRLIEY